jgi:DNA polymerase-3 subunit gamma/tau
MFENIIAQDAAQNLVSDIRGGTMAKAMLFAGPEASGKGTAALELARALSCEDEDAPWGCACSDCRHHKALSHPDLLCLGPRPFQAEIAASAAAYLRAVKDAPEGPVIKSVSALFTRAVKKLILRFSPVLWEDDPKISKINASIENLNESLEEFRVGQSKTEVEKLIDNIKKNAQKLENEGIADNIPTGQVRRATYWLHLAPSSRCKTLIIENADRMQDAARNSLLKTLEEPPPKTAIVLTSASPSRLLATVLSRLRPYHFHERQSDDAKSVLTRIFRDHAGDLTDVAAYLDSYSDVPHAVIREIAGIFLESLAGNAETKKSALAKTLEKAGNFDSRGSFQSFLECLLLSYRDRTMAGGVPAISDRDRFSSIVKDAVSAHGTYNLSPAATLERVQCAAS